MPPGTTNGHTQPDLASEVLSLKTEFQQFKETILATPRLFRKDVQRLLGISSSTLDRRMKRRDFPKAIYDAGRPKWTPSQFSGQTGQ